MNNNNYKLKDYLIIFYILHYEYKDYKLLEITLLF